jgi:chromosome segregation ATPase
LIAQLEGLRQREETIAKEKETLITEKGRLNDSIRALNSQARLIEDFGEKETQDATRRLRESKTRRLTRSLIQKRAELTARLEKLKAQYREKHPEVVDTKTQIDKVNEELEALSKNTTSALKKPINRVRAKPSCKSRIWKSKNKKPKAKSRRSTSRCNIKMRNCGKTPDKFPFSKRKSTRFRTSKSRSKALIININRRKRLTTIF